MKNTLTQLKEKLPYIVCVILAIALVVVPLVGFHMIMETREAARIAMEQAHTPTPAPTAEPAPQPARLSIADQSEHPALMVCMPDGMFCPSEAVTRGDVADGLKTLLKGPAAARKRLVWSDRQEDPVTRSELTELLRELSGLLAGAEYDRAESLAQAIESGGLSGNEAEPDGAEYVTRAEAAMVLVTLSGRQPSGGLLILAELLPPDVGTDHWAWAYITDAVTEGEIPRREAGLYRINGWLYAAGEDGELLRSTTMGVWTFGPDGRYTTGDEELDGYLEEALRESGADALTGREALEAAYLYIKRNYEYIMTPLDETPEEDGSTGWEFERALRFFRTGGGTCYGYAAGFGLMARSLGEDAKIVAARINQYDWPHSMVVIPEDGKDWIYDVELEDTRPERHGDLALFHILDFEVYSYWYTPDW